MNKGQVIRIKQAVDEMDKRGYTVAGFVVYDDEHNIYMLWGTDDQAKVQYFQRRLIESLEDPDNTSIETFDNPIKQ